MWKRPPRARLGVSRASRYCEELEVRLPSDTKRADDEIAARAIDILKWQVGLPADRIKVKVEKGIVTPTGDLSTGNSKEPMPSTLCTSSTGSLMSPIRSRRVSSPCD